MKSHRLLAVVPAAIAAWAFTAAAPVASAAVVVGSPAAFLVSTEVMDQEGGTSTSRSNTLLGTVDVQRFDPGLGVLTGATVRIRGQRTQSLTMTGQGNAVAKSTAGTGSSTARVEGAGASATFAQVSVSGTCTAVRNCVSTTVAPAVATTATLDVAAGRLGDWTGAGTVALSLSAPLLSATQLTSSYTGVERSTYGLQWAGDVAVDYRYLLHALPSFDGGALASWDIDFGTHRRGAAAGPRAFELFNGAGDVVGLDLDEILGFGDTAALLTDLRLFDDLGAGRGMGFLAFFDTLEAGDFRATYRLSLSNTGIGSAAGIDPVRTLTLTLHGRVLDDAAALAVPEPGSLPLVALGAALLVLGHRRRS